MITFIVSVFDRPEFLNCCLASLVLQGGADIIVANNCSDPAITERIREVCARYGARHAFTGAAYGAAGCYDSANIVVRDWSTKEWLCFASDDSYYVAQFSNVMLEAAERESADLVYCDCVYRCGENGSPRWPPYTVLNTQPRTGRIDKTCFIVRRGKFQDFPEHRQGYRDGALIEHLVAQGVKHAKAPGILVVHQ